MTEWNGPEWPKLGDAERFALREILISGPLSRVEIARRLGVSRSSLTRVIRRLVELGFVIEGDAQLRAKTGRPSEMLHINASARCFVGIKLTGERLFAVVTDLSATVLEARERRIELRTVDGVTGLIADVVSEFAAQGYRPTAVGVALAGDVVVIDGREVVADSTYLGWDDVPLGSVLGQKLGCPVAVQNDVMALTAAEHWFGAGAGTANLVVITIGVGLGSGIVANGELVAGANGRAGRFDHVLVDAAGSICGLGHRGCASAYATNEAILRGIGIPGLSYEDAVAKARADDPAVLRAFRDAGRALGTVIGTVVNVFDPEKVILTGDGIAVVDFAYREIREAMQATRLPGVARTALDIQPFEFTEWARGGAVAAIQLRIAS